MSESAAVQGVVYKTVIASGELEVHAWALFGTQPAERIELRLGDEILASAVPSLAVKHGRANPDDAGELPCAVALRLSLDKATTADVVRGLSVHAVDAAGRAERIAVALHAAPYFAAVAESVARQRAVDKLRAGKVGPRIVASYAVARLSLIEGQAGDEIPETIQLLADAQLTLGRVNTFMLRVMLKSVNAWQPSESFPAKSRIAMTCALLACAALNSKSVAGETCSRLLQQTVQAVPASRYSGLDWPAGQALVMSHFYLCLMQFRNGEIDAVMRTAAAAMPIMKSLLVSIPLSADNDYPLADRVIWSGYIVYMLAHIYAKPIERYAGSPASRKDFLRHVQRLLPAKDWLPIVTDFLGESIPAA